MLEKLKARAKAANEWLMTPMVAARRLSRRFFVQLLRSRFFLLCAVLTALPFLFNASAVTWKAEQSWLQKSEVNWLLWANAFLTWVLFLLTASYNYWKLKRGERRKV